VPGEIDGEVNIYLLVRKEVHRFLFSDANTALQTQVLFYIRTSTGDVAKCAMIFLVAIYWAARPGDVPTLIYQKIKNSISKMKNVKDRDELLKNFWKPFCRAQRAASKNFLKKSCNGCYNLKENGKFIDDDEQYVLAERKIEELHALEFKDDL